MEPERDQFLDTLESARHVTVSVINFVEVGIRVDKDPNRRRADALEEIMKSFAVEIAPVTLEQGRLAREAHRRYGRGSGHPAKLNLGDCFAYALAKARRAAPLQGRGQDRYRGRGLIALVAPAPRLASAMCFG